MSFSAQNQKVSFLTRLGTLEDRVASALQDLASNQIVQRIWTHDHTVWRPEPTEIDNRLGWLHSIETMRPKLSELQAFVEGIRTEGYTQALLLGMGGSSLAPEVFRVVFGVESGFLDLAVLDSTDPGAVLQFADRFHPARTLFIVSTKSGGTVETLSFFKFFYNLALEKLGGEEVGKHFVAITDPGSKLEAIAAELKFRRCFLNDPNIGGRFSVLSYFGLVPAALLGLDLGRLLERGQKMAERCKFENPAENPGARLGAIMGETAARGRDKLTLVASPALAHFGAWVEQLIAESTGKEGKGILPVDGETLGPPEVYGEDRLFVQLRPEDDTAQDEKVDALAAAGHPVVRLTLSDRYDLGAEFFRWEFATSVAGHILGINPFDQPNVESAKVLARKMVAEFQKTGVLPEPTPSLEDRGIKVYSAFSAAELRAALQTFLREAQAGRSYVALQAYIQPLSQVSAALQALRMKIRDRLRVATTVGYGPRFLHSTGQLHKGDGGNGLFIQFTAEMPKDTAIPDEAGKPGSSISFGVLKKAQALGDRQALLDAGRKVLRLHLGTDPAADLRHVADLI